MEVAFLGMAGAGKGFFAAICSRRLGLAHLSMGDLLRAEAATDPALGERLARGELVDDATCLRLLSAGISAARATSAGVLVDGVPRSLRQAELLEERHRLWAVDIRLDPAVAREKLLGRRRCATCGEGFNLAHIVRDGFNMPAILPDPAKCSLGAECSPRLMMRDDDTAEVIDRRLEQHRREAEPILRFFEERGRLRLFQVRRGAEDAPKLVHLLETLGPPP